MEDIFTNPFEAEVQDIFYSQNQPYRRSISSDKVSRDGQDLRLRHKSDSVYARFKHSDADAVSFARRPLVSRSDSRQADSVSCRLDRLTDRIVRRMSTPDSHVYSTASVPVVATTREDSVSQARSRSEYSQRTERLVLDRRGLASSHAVENISDVHRRKEKTPLSEHDTSSRFSQSAHNNVSQNSIDLKSNIDKMSETGKVSPPSTLTFSDHRVTSPGGLSPDDIPFIDSPDHSILRERMHENDDDDVKARREAGECHDSTVMSGYNSERCQHPSPSRIHLMHARLVNSPSGCGACKNKPCICGSQV